MWDKKNKTFLQFYIRFVYYPFFSEILKKNVNPDATTINEEILRQQGLEIGNHVT